MVRNGASLLRNCVCNGMCILVRKGVHNILRNLNEFRMNLNEFRTNVVTLSDQSIGPFDGYNYAPNYSSNYSRNYARITQIFAAGSAMVCSTSCWLRECWGKLSGPGWYHPTRMEEGAEQPEGPVRSQGLQARHGRGKR